MFRCYDCGEKFEEPKIEYEDRGEFWGMPAFEPMAYCPCCGSDDFDDMRDFNYKWFAHCQGVEYDEEMEVEV